MGAHRTQRRESICLLLVLTYYTLIPCLYCALRPLSKPLFMSILMTELKSPTFVNLHGGKPCCRVTKKQAIIICVIIKSTQ